MKGNETEYWNAIGTEWDRDGPDALWRRHSDAINHQLLAKWLPTERVEWIAKHDAFDEAVGTGMMETLGRHANHLLAMDLSCATLVAARKRNPNFRGIAADARRLPIEANRLDLVLSNSTLDHFRTHAELRLGLEELHRVLKPGGTLLLTLDNPYNPLVAVRNILPFGLLHRIGLLPYFVGATVGVRRLRSMLTEIGFEIKDSTAVLHCPRALAVRWARRLSRRGDRAAQDRFLARLLRMEGMGKWPTRFLSGYFTAIRAVKRG